MTITDGVAIAACGVALTAGIAALKIAFSMGQVVADVHAIKAMLGNGEQGVFVRRDEMTLLLKDAEKEHGRMWDELHETQREVRELKTSSS